MQLVNGSSTTRTDVYRLLYSNPLGWLSIAFLGGFFYVKITWNNMRRGYGVPNMQSFGLCIAVVSMSICFLFFFSIWCTVADPPVNNRE